MHLLIWSKRSVHVSGKMDADVWDSENGLLNVHQLVDQSGVTLQQRERPFK